MTTINPFINTLKSITAFVAIVFLMASPVVSAASIPSCTITVSPAAITSAQSATLSWESTEGAVFASLDNGIGSIAADGKMVISPNKNTVYTMHTWNARGEGGYCSTALTIGAAANTGTGGPVPTYTPGVQPTVSVQTLAVHPAATRVVLTSVPYTGPVEDALYSFFLLSLILTAGYVAKNQRKAILG